MLVIERIAELREKQKRITKEITEELEKLYKEYYAEQLAIASHPPSR